MTKDFATTAPILPQPANTPSKRLCWPWCAGLCRKTQALDLCLAGGTALNFSANKRLRCESGFPMIFIPPAPRDAGTALGCAVYGMSEILKAPCAYRWRHDYLGPEPATDEVETAVARASHLIVTRPQILPPPSPTCLPNRGS